MAERCVNIDWLEVYCLEDIQHFPMNATFYEKCGWYVDVREYGTRVYAEMFTLIDKKGNRLFEVRRNPMSQLARDGGLFPPNSCHIRLTNAACYYPNPIALLRDFLAQNNYTFGKIFRLDLCLDFWRFDSGDMPGAFVRRYMRGSYSKINQSELAAHGTDNWSGRVWQSLSWGKKKSMVSTKMYCKSLELQQVHDKPYIRQAWLESGLVDDPYNLICHKKDSTPFKVDIWRVEFSLKSSAARSITIECNNGKKKMLKLPHTLSTYDTKAKQLAMFATLAEHYFHFKKYKPNVRKDRCEDKILFKFSPRDSFYDIQLLAKNSPLDNRLHRLLSNLRNFREHQPDTKVRDACNVLISYITQMIMTDFGGSSKRLAEFRRFVAEQFAYHKRQRILQLMIDAGFEPDDAAAADSQQAVQ